MSMTKFRLKIRASFLTVDVSKHCWEKRSCARNTFQHSTVFISQNSRAAGLLYCFLPTDASHFHIFLSFCLFYKSYLNEWWSDTVKYKETFRFELYVVLLPFRQQDINEMHLHHCKTLIGNKHFHFSSGCSFPSFLYSMFLFLPLPANSQNVLIKNLRDDIVLEFAARIQPFLAPWRTVGQPRKSLSCFKCLFIIICSYLA